MSPRRPLRALRAGGLAVVLAALGAGSAQAAVPSGPAFDVPQAQLDAALRCSTGGSGEPILLIPGTGADPAQNFDRSWVPALDAQGRRWCTVTLPKHATDDIQVAAEYVTNAIRTMSDRAGGGKIAMVGHSQGGMVGRWSLKWWPDTRALVSDYVSIAGSNHGTTDADAACAAAGSCTPANWQQASKSKFIAALNAGAETYSGIAYTDVYTPNDEVVQPNADAITGSTSLRTGRGDIENVKLTDVCPGDTSEHLLVGSLDNTAFRLALDAVDRQGPADPVAVHDALGSSCQTGSPPVANAIPGVNAGTLAALTSEYFANMATAAAQVPAEPALKAYVAAGAAPDAADAPPATTTTTSTATTATTAPATPTPPAPGPAPSTAPTVATSQPAPAAERVASRLVARLVRSRDRTAPFRFVLRGRVTTASGARPAQGCSGTVTVRVKTAGGKTVSSRRVRVGSSCAFTSRVSFRATRRLGRSGRLSFRASYAGSASLRSSTARAVTGRVR